MGWFFKQKYKVFLPFGLIEVESRFGEYKAIASPALAEWLQQCGYSYTLLYSRGNGSRWVEFNDKQAATLCKLTFG